VENVPEFRAWGLWGPAGRPLKMSAQDVDAWWRRCGAGLLRGVARAVRGRTIGDPTTRRRCLCRRRGAGGHCLAGADAQ
jgi:hypothetical protein